MKFTEEEVVRGNNNSYINVTNEGAKKDKLESMEFGRKLFSSDLTSGQITMKILLNFDIEKCDCVFQSTVNGLYEEFAVSKEYIVYTLQTKKFEFGKEN